jgi:site-specific recombinase XerD
MDTTTKEKYNRPKKSEDDLNLSREEQDRLFSYWTAKKDEALKRGASRPVKTWFMFKFIIGTGLRATEACNVQITDLNLDTKTPNVVVRNGKGNRRRTVYISNSLVADIKWFLNYKRKALNHTTEANDYLFVSERGGKMNQPGLYYVWAGACKKALGRTYGVHAGRHTFGYNLYSKERDIKAVKTQLGHANIATTDRYTRVTPEDIVRQMNA